MRYYYSANGQPVGPMEKAELLGKNITPDTLVWVDGMDIWKPAREVPHFADILDGSYAEELREAKRRERNAELSRRRAETRPQRVAYSPSDYPQQGVSEPPVSNPNPAPPVHPQTPVTPKYDQPMYHAVINGCSVGPMPLTEMRAAGVTEATMVWTEGMAEWTRAANVGAVMQALAAECTSTAPNVTLPPMPPIPGNRYRGAAHNPAHVSSASPLAMVPPPTAVTQGATREYKNYMTSAVICTVLGAIGFIVSISGLYYSLLFALGTLVCGIVACTKASQGNRLRALGNLAEANRFASQAKSLLTVAYILFGVSIILGIITMLIGLAWIGVLMSDNDIWASNILQ